CRAADAGSQNYSNRGLAEAFVERGARAVFAATVPIPDREADAFFNAIRERIRAGKAPAVALAEARAEYVAPGEATDWMADVVALEPAPVRRTASPRYCAAKIRSSWSSYAPVPHEPAVPW